MGRTAGWHLELAARELDRLLGPGLPGAACRGRAPEFDAEVSGETAQQRRDRHARAAAICTGCPVRDRCRAVADELPRRLRSGTWAARPYA